MPDDFPRDPFMLFSHINMLLRDEFSSLEDLCAHKDVNREVLETILGAVGFEYSAENNKFW